MWIPRKVLKVGVDERLFVLTTLADVVVRLLAGALLSVVQNGLEALTLVQALHKWMPRWMKIKFQPRWSTVALDRTGVTRQMGFLSRETKYLFSVALVEKGL